MKNLIPITNLPNVYGVKMEDCFHDFKIENHSNIITFLIEGSFHGKRAGETINIGKTFTNDFEILGTITATEISFDASDVVDDFQFYYEDLKKHVFHYKDYNPKKQLLHDVYCFKTPEQSFRSALEVEGIRFENEFGEKPDDEFYSELGHSYVTYLQALEKWQTAEANKTQKLLIIRKV